MTTFVNRLELWRASLGLFASSPIFGAGYGAGRYLVGDYLRQYSWQIHNDYLSVLLETGVVGAGLFLLWHGQWLLALFKAFWKSGFEDDRTLALAVFAVFVVSLVSRISDNVLIDSYKLYPLCALVAAALSLARIRAASQPDVDDSPVLTDAA
jgi:O-antigen ligase